MIPRRPGLGVQRTLHPTLIRGMEKRLIFADDVDGGRFFSYMDQQALETGTKIYARFLMPHDAPILLRSEDCAATGCFDFCSLSDPSQKEKERINLVNSVPKNHGIDPRRESDQ